jgi:hypothetical protein
MRIADAADHQQAGAEHDDGEEQHAKFGGGGKKFAEDGVDVQCGQFGSLTGKGLLHQDHRRDGPSRAGGGQAEETEMMLLAVLVADVEAGEAEGGAAHEERANGPDRAVGEQGQVARSGLSEEQEHHKRRGRAEADDIGEAVELAAEVGGVAGEAGEAAIEGVEDHRQENQIRRRGHAARSPPVCQGIV